MSMKPMKPIPQPTKENSFDSLGGIKPHLDMMLDYISNDLCEEFSGDSYFNKMRHSTEPYTTIVGEEGYISLSIYPNLIKGKPFISLCSIFLRKKYRGKGIGDRMIRKLISLVYDCEVGHKGLGYKTKLGIILKPTDIVYSDGSLVQNHTFLSREELKPLMDEPFYKQTLMEQSEENLSIPNNLRKKRHKRNTKRLKSYYKRFGFSSYGKESMILDMEVN